MKIHPNPEEAGYDSRERSTGAEELLIRAIIRGDIEEFEFRTLHVVRENDSLVVMDPPMHQQLGGRLFLMPGQKISHIHGWLGNKAREHGPTVEL